MGGTILWKFWLVWALFASPAVPIVFAWRRMRKDVRARTAWDVVPLVIATISTLWFDAAVANWSFVGQGSADLRHVLIGGNLIAAFVCAAVVFLMSFSPVARGQRLAVGLACLMLMAEWSFLGIVDR